VNDRDQHHTVGDALYGLVIILAYTWPYVLIFAFAIAAMAVS
jgi:hypothetical protein